MMEVSILKHMFARSADAQTSKLCVKLYACLFLLFLSASPVWADVLFTNEYQVTTSDNFETFPRLGNDGLTDILVYVSIPEDYIGPRHIYYQRLINGVPEGDAVKINDEDTYGTLCDISGDYIVYATFDDPNYLSSSIMLYQISTGTLQLLRSSENYLRWTPRIHDHTVVWNEDTESGRQVLLYELAWLGTPLEPIQLAEPIPHTHQVEIGDRFVVWAQSEMGQFDIMAYDREKCITIQLTDTEAISESSPETSGPWVVWQAQDHGSSETRIEAYNMDTWELRVVCDNGEMAFYPTIYGDLITYDSNLTGFLGVYLYRLSTDETFQVTASDTIDHYLSDIFGSLVAYVDMRYGSEDIFVSTIELVHDVDIEVSPSSIDFEIVEVETSAYETITISNLGSEDLTVYSFGLESGSELPYSVYGPSTPFSISPSEVAELYIRFLPLEQGFYPGTLVIYCDDPDETLVEVPLSGVGAYISEGPILSWIHQFGTSTSDDAAAVTVDNTGIYVSGYTDGVLPGQINLGGFDAFVCKYDFEGNEIWCQQYGTSESDFIYGMTVDSSGVYLVGSTYGTMPDQTSYGPRDAFISRYDLEGNHIWTRQFGSSMDEFAYQALAHSSGVYVCGSTEGELPSQASEGGWDAFIREYDLDGNELWTSQFGTGGDDYGSSVSMGDGVYVSGHTDGVFPNQDSEGSFDVFIRKFSFAGTPMWTRQYGSIGEDRTFDSDIDSTGIYIVGYATGALPGQSEFGLRDAFILKYSSEGDLLWTRQFGTAENDVASEISAYSGLIYIAGSTAGSLPGYINSGSHDAFLYKHDAAGTQDWIFQFGSYELDILPGIDVNAHGIFAAGYTLGYLPDQMNLGEHDAFIVAILTPNTLEGTNVEILDSETGVVITYDEILHEGTTVVETSDTGPAIPGGFEFLGTYYEITTSADFEFNINIAIPYDDTQLLEYGILPSEEASLLKLWHWNTVTLEWEDVTIHIDTDNNIIYGLVTDLSFFTICFKTPVTIITSISGPSYPVIIGTEIEVVASYTNPMITNTHTAQWEWDDGSDPDIIPDADYTVTGSHTYTEVGDYIVTFTVTDYYGSVDTDSICVSVLERMPTIFVQPSAKIGESITIHGIDYNPDKSVKIQLRNPDLEVASYEWIVNTDPTGSFTLTIIVPEVEFLPYYLLESVVGDVMYTSSYLLVLPVDGFMYREITSGDTVNENTVMTGYNKVEGAPIGIDIVADDVVLICESPDILVEGTPALSFGINVQDVDNVSIYGFNISDCGVGIRLSGASDCLIDHCVITDTVTGIGIGQKIAGTGIIYNNVVCHNVLERVENGVSAYLSMNTEIRFNSFKEVKQGVSISASENAVISKNVIDGVNKPEGSRGIIIDDYSSHNSVYRNTISDLEIGVRILYSDDNVVTHNSVDNTSTAVQIAFMSKNNRVEYNTMQNSSYGLYVSSPYNNISYNDILYNIQEGIRIEYTDHINVIKNNIVNNTGKGILMQSGSGFHVIKNNTIDNNGQIGISLGLESDTTITNNIITNHDIGLRFGQAHIYNNIISNTVNTDRCEGNTFYIEPEPGLNIIGGPKIGGNFWSGYTGSDANGDGFGDAPYESNGVFDKYPLVEFTNRPPIADMGDHYQSNEGSTIIFDASDSFDPDGHALQYRWDIGNNGTWDTPYREYPTFSISWPDDASLEVAVEVTDGYYTDIDTAEWIVLNVAPIVNAGSDLTVCECEIVAFEGSFTDPAKLVETYTIRWRLGDGTILYGSLTPSYKYATPGTYVVELMVNDTDGGIGFDYLIVTVKQHIEDAYHYEGLPNNNYGDWSALWIGYYGTNMCRTLIKFCDHEYDMPSDAVLIEASLGLYGYARSGSAGKISAHRIVRDWSETTTTWNNWPGYMIWPSAYAQIGAAQTWYWLDVTDDVLLFKQNLANNYGWMLYGDFQTLDFTGVFLSSESTYPPVLFVHFKVPTQTSISTDTNLVDKTGENTVTISGYLSTSYCHGNIPIEIYYSRASSATDIPSSGFTQLAEVRTSNSGYYEFDWDPPESLENGYYCIKVVKGDFGYHYPSFNTTGGSNDHNILVTAPLEPDPSILSWWQGEDNPYDIISGNHGEEINGVSYSTGKFGRAFSFDGVDDEILAPDIKIHDIQELTIEGWVYLNSLPNRIQRFVTLSPGLERAVLRYNGFNEYAGQLHFYMKIGDENSPFTHLTATNVLNAETWHHVAATYDGSQMRLFLDGSEVAHKFVSGPVVIGGEPTVRLSAAAEPLDGKLDEISVYDRALDAEEIASAFVGKMQPFPIFGDTITSSITLERDLINCPEDGLIVGAHGITIDGNGHKITGTGSGDGIKILEQNGVIIENLLVSGFDNGVYVEGGTQNEVKGNYMYDNSCGIHLFHSIENNITNNQIVENFVGIYLGRSKSNSIYHNLLIKNKDQIREEEGYINIWMDPVDGVGNFWSNYWGNDTNGDRIGDTDLPHEGVDYAPCLDPGILEKYGSFLYADWWLGWRGNWLPSNIQLTDPIGQILSRDVNEIGLNAFYFEDTEMEPNSNKAMVLVSTPYLLNPLSVDVYSFQMTALEDLTYSMEWFVSGRGEVLFDRSIEEAPLEAGQERFIETELTQNPDGTLTVEPVPQYIYGGIMQPINSDGSSVFKQGRTIPVKFQLCDEENTSVDTAHATIKLTKISEEVLGDFEEVISTSAANTGNVFRYDSESEQYIFNLSTENLNQGTYLLDVSLDDGQVFSVQISLR